MNGDTSSQILPLGDNNSRRMKGDGLSAQKARVMKPGKAWTLAAGVTWSAVDKLGESQTERGSHDLHDGERDH